MRIDLWNRETGAWINAIEAESVASAAALFPDLVANQVAGGQGFSLVNGQAVAPPPPPQPVPTAVTPLQARRALRAAGLLAVVNAAVAAAPDEVQEAWEYAVEIRRDNALIAQVAAALDPPMTEAQLDELFRTAAAIVD